MYVVDDAGTPGARMSRGEFLSVCRNVGNGCAIANVPAIRQLIQKKRKERKERKDRKERNEQEKWQMRIMSVDRVDPFKPIAVDDSS